MAKRKKKKSKFGWVTICFIAFVIYFAVVMVVTEVQINSQEAEVSKLEDKLNSIELGNKEMAEQKAIAGSKEYMEYILRTKLGWIKSDEIKYSTD